MEQLPHYLEFCGTMPLVHVRAHHQSAATRFRVNVRKSGKTESQKTGGKKLFSVIFSRYLQILDLLFEYLHIPTDRLTYDRVCFNLHDSQKDYCFKFVELM